MGKGEEKRGAFSAVSPLQERLYDNKNTLLFFGFSSRIGLTYADITYIMGATRKELVMLDMVLSFVGQAVAMVFCLGLVLLGAAIVSAIFD